MTTSVISPRLPRGQTRPKAHYADIDAPIILAADFYPRQKSILSPKEAKRVLTLLESRGVELSVEQRNELIKLIYAESKNLNLEIPKLHPSAHFFRRKDYDHKNPAPAVIAGATTGVTASTAPSGVKSLVVSGFKAAGAACKSICAAFIATRPVPGPEWGGGGGDGLKKPEPE
jgi:hypothetical protein